MLLSKTLIYWGSSVSETSSPCNVSIISTSKWLADAMTWLCDAKDEWQVTQRCAWTETSQWPKEDKAQLRILILTPHTALSESCIKTMTSVASQLPTLVLATHHDDVWMKVLLRDHALGYVTIDQGHDEFCQALKHLQAHESYVPQCYVKSLMTDSPKVSVSLTHRERAVGKLLVAGATHQEIASTLHISDKTVSTHKTNILKRLGLSHLPDLVRFHDRHPFIFKSSPKKKRSR